MALNRNILLTLLILFVSYLSASAQMDLPWYYSFPSTAEGQQKKELVELYRKNADYRNVQLVCSYARNLEPGCFYFVDLLVQSSYNIARGDEVLKLSDSLIRSDFATSQTFLYNAWIHDWKKDENGAIHGIDRGIELYPDDFALLRAGMKLASEYGKDDLINKYGKLLLFYYPNDWETYYNYLLYFDSKSLHDYAIIMGELALSVAPNNRKNVAIKFKLMDNYNAWLQKGEASDAFTSLRKLPEDMSQIATMEDLIRFQSTMVFNYAYSPNTNYLERRLFDFKLRVLNKCNWIAYCYDRFGISIFPRDYERYVSQSQEMLAELNICMSNIPIN